MDTFSQATTTAFQSVTNRRRTFSMFQEGQTRLLSPEHSGKKYAVVIQTQMKD